MALNPDLSWEEIERVPMRDGIFHWEDVPEDRFILKERLQLPFFQVYPMILKMHDERVFYYDRDSFFLPDHQYFYEYRIYEHGEGRFQRVSKLAVKRRMEVESYESITRFEASDLMRIK
jgi:hypothetical protein